MARPTTGRTGKPMNLYLSPEIANAVRKRAFNQGMSLSQFVELLMKRSEARASK